MPTFLKWQAIGDHLKNSNVGGTYFKIFLSKVEFSTLLMHVWFRQRVHVSNFLNITAMIACLSLSEIEWHFKLSVTN